MEALVLNNQRYKGIVFDFDYTLGDSTEGIVQSANAALVRLGYEKRSREEIRKTIGLSLKRTCQVLTGDMEEAKAELFARYFKEKADEVMVACTELYPSVKELLIQLKAEGFKTAIVTTKFHYRIVAILEKFQAEELFDLIIGSEDVKIEKPDPEGLLKVTEMMGVSKAEVLYVGDSLVDAKTAQNAGVDFIGVLTGTTVREEFEDYPHLAVLGHAAELIAK